MEEILFSVKISCHPLNMVNAAEEGEGNVECVEGASWAWFMSEVEICALNLPGLKKDISSWGLKPKGKKKDLKQMQWDCMEKIMHIVDARLAHAN